MKMFGKKFLWATVKDQVGELLPSCETDQTRLIPLGGVSQKHSATLTLQEHLLEGLLGEFRRARPGASCEPRACYKGDVTLQAVKHSERGDPGQGPTHPAELPS